MVWGVACYQASGGSTVAAQATQAPACRCCCSPQVVLGARRQAAKHERQVHAGPQRAHGALDRLQRRLAVVSRQVVAVMAKGRRGSQQQGRQSGLETHASMGGRGGVPSRAAAAKAGMGTHAKTPTLGDSHTTASVKTAGWRSSAVRGSCTPARAAAAALPAASPAAAAAAAVAAAAAARLPCTLPQPGLAPPLLLLPAACSASRSTASKLTSPKRANAARSACTQHRHR